MTDPDRGDDEEHDHEAVAPLSEPSLGPTQCGFVAVIGAPNAGKSTLTNALVGGKVSIVTHKVQTTRSRLRGIFVEGATQVVLIDTPGIFAPKRRLDKAMVQAAWEGAGEADQVLLIVDAARGLEDDVKGILERLSAVPMPRLLVLNKIDRVSKPDLLALTKAITDALSFEAVFMVSALNGSGLADLRAHLAATMPEGPWHFDADQMSDAPMRVLAAEITREKLFMRLHDELPYQLHVETEGWEERKDGSVRIEQTIYVIRDSQRRIVIGAGGATIKAVSMEARKEIGAILEQTVHLFLFVKVRERWVEDPERYRALGLDLPD